MPTTDQAYSAYVIQSQDLDGSWQDILSFPTSGDNACQDSWAAVARCQQVSSLDAARGITKAPIRRIFRTEVVCPDV